VFHRGVDGFAVAGRDEVEQQPAGDGEPEPGVLLRGYVLDL
jgi:hypothetical protein